MISLGSCDNNYGNMEYGGLIPKGPKCGNRATLVMVYVETINPWDGKPNTVETAKLCDSCFAHARGLVRAHRRFRTKRKGSAEGSSWVRRITSFPPEKVTAEHITALCRSYKRVPQATLDHFGLDRDGKPVSDQVSELDLKWRAIWSG
jgi:hypothetical protein